MKKTLLALTAAAILPAVGQAQTNIVLNGSIDVALESLNDDANDGESDLKVSNGVWKGSRFAITGSEDLGAGLKGIFNLEHRLSPDTGTVTSGETFWAGQAWVGLQGGFGTVRLGRQYTPVRRALEPGDVTDFSWYNNGEGLGDTTTRFNNDVSYQSPRLGGITIHAAYAAGESTVTPIDRDRGDSYGIAGIGRFGPATIGLGFQSISAGDQPGIDDTTELALSLGATFANIGIGLAGAQNEVDNVKRKAYFLSGSIGLGAGTIYLVLKHDDQGTGLDDTGLGLTYSYGFSKRTFLYASLGYNRIEQEDGVDAKPRQVALGVRHVF